MKKKLTDLRVKGSFKGCTGFDHHVRELVRGMVGKGIRIQLEDNPYWSPAKLPPADQEPWFDSLNEPVPAELFLQFDMPLNAWPAPHQKNINFTMFEATHIPADWVVANHHHDGVIVPAKSSLEAWVKSGYPQEKIRLCPLGIRPELFHKTEPLLLNFELEKPFSSYRVRMLNVSDTIPRKNLISLLRTWVRATKREDDAILLVKLGVYHPHHVARFRTEFNEMVRADSKKLEEAAPFLFFTQLLPSKDMPNFYATGTHYISMSHGEGWDLPMMEAGAAGLRLIAPAHSAYLTYLDNGIAQMIPSKVVPADFGEKSDSFKGLYWWEPNPDAAVEMIQKAIAGNDLSPIAARTRILEQYGWDQAASRLVEALESFYNP